jgi:hypothetical protein
VLCELFEHTGVLFLFDAFGGAQSVTGRTGTVIVTEPQSTNLGLA